MKFGRDNVHQTLKSHRASPEERQKLEEALRRLHAPPSSSESDADSDGDALEKMTSDEIQRLQEVPTACVRSR